MDQQTLAKEILYRASVMAEADLTQLTNRELSRFMEVNENLSLLASSHFMTSAVKRSFLIYTFVAAGLSILLLTFGINPVSVLMSVLAVSAGIAAWLTYTLYVFSKAIDALLTEYDEFLKRASVKEQT